MTLIRRVFGPAFVLAAWLYPACAQALLIDFENFNEGDGIAEVNAFLSGFGLTFDTIEFEALMVASEAGNQFIRVNTNPLGADFLINFDDPVSSITADILGNPGNQAQVSLEVFDQNNTPLTLIGFLDGVFPNDEPPITLSVELAVAAILSAALEEGAGEILIDNIFIPDLPDIRPMPGTAVPEPTSFGLFFMGLLGLAWAWRRERG